MHNKFKIDEMVIVNGIGKENGTIYKNRIAKVICRDPFYFDYNIKSQTKSIINNYVLSIYIITAIT